MKRIFWALRITVVCLATLAMNGCTGSDDSPTSPSSGPAGSVTSVVSTASLASNGYSYRTTFSVREIGGGTGLTVSSVRIQFSNASGSIGGATFSDNPMMSAHVDAGGSADSKSLTVTDEQNRPLATQVSVTVNYTDDRGTAGSITGTGNVTGGGSPPSGSGSDYTFVSGSIRCTQPGNSVGNCTGSIVLTVRPNFPAGTRIGLQSFPGTFRYSGVMPSAAPANVTFTMTSGQIFCFEPGPINTGTPIPSPPERYVIVQEADQYNLPSPLPVQCSR
jgi:hypothetical protein